MKTSPTGRLDRRSKEVESCSIYVMLHWLTQAMNSNTNTIGRCIKWHGVLKKLPAKKKQLQSFIVLKIFEITMRIDVFSPFHQSYFSIRLNYTSQFKESNFIINFNTSKNFGPQMKGYGSVFETFIFYVCFFRRVRK